MGGLFMLMNLNSSMNLNTTYFCILLQPRYLLWKMHWCVTLDAIGLMLTEHLIQVGQRLDYGLPDAQVFQGV